MAVLAALAADDEPTSPAAAPRAAVERAIENVGFGPLRLGTQSPFPALRLSLAPHAPSSLPAGRWELSETLTWSRIWGTNDRYLLSFETLNATHSAAVGLTDRVRFEFGLTQVTRFGGKLDGFVRGFHDTVGLQQGGRDSLPRGSFAFELRGEETVSLDEQSARNGSEYAFVRVEHRFMDGDDVAPAASLSLAVKTDLGDSEDIVGVDVEFSVSLALAKRLGDFYAYVDVDVSWHGRDRFHGVEMEPLGVSVSAALEWAAGADASVVLQYLWTRGSLVDFGDFSEASNELSLGLKIQVARGAVLELAVTENLVVLDNSPDFGVHAGLTTRF